MTDRINLAEIENDGRDAALAGWTPERNPYRPWITGAGYYRPACYTPENWIARESAWKRGFDDARRLRTLAASFAEDMTP